MDSDEPKKGFQNTLHETIFSIDCENKPHKIILIILWILEKITVLSQICLQVFSTSSQTSIKEICGSLFIIPLLSGEGIEILGVVLCCLTLIFLGLLILRITNLVPNFTTASLIDNCLSIFLNLNFRILVQLLCLISFLLFMIILGHHTYPEYKGLPTKEWGSGASSHIVPLVCSSLGLLVSLALNIVFIILFQSRSMIIWSTKECETKLLDFGIKLIIFSIFVIDVEDSFLLLSSLIVVGLLAMKVIIRHRLPLPPERLQDLADQFFDSLALVLELIIFMSNFVPNFDLQNNYQYMLFSPIISLVICSIKYNKTYTISLQEIKNDEESIDLLQKVISFCLIQEEYKSLVWLSAILTSHFKNCNNPDCKCSKLLHGLRDRSSYYSILEKNSAVFENKQLLPSTIKKSWKVKMLRILLKNISLTSGNYFLRLILAEIQFCYIGNYYLSLQYIQEVEAYSESIIARQYSLNLRKKINKGMQNDDGDGPNLESVIQFMKYYNDFIDQFMKFRNGSKKWRFVIVVEL